VMSAFRSYSSAKRSQRLWRWQIRTSSLTACSFFGSSSRMRSYARTASSVSSRRVSAMEAISSSHPIASVRAFFGSWYAPDNLVVPDYIRVEADEATYNLHILLRFELERALAKRDLKPKDVADEWNSRFEKYFGIKVDHDGNGCLQDILFRARVDPRRKVATLSAKEKRALFRALRDTLEQAIAQNGRDCERDAYGNRGGYKPLMDRNTKGTPCPECGTTIEKIQYLGGSCYFCSNCQT